jgi:hypothetical protein
MVGLHTRFLKKRGFSTNRLKFGGHFLLLEKFRIARLRKLSKVFPKGILEGSIFRKVIGLL